MNDDVVLLKSNLSKYLAYMIWQTQFCQFSSYKWKFQGWRINKVLLGLLDFQNFTGVLMSLTFCHHKIRWLISKTDGRIVNPKHTHPGTIVWM